MVAIDAGGLALLQDPVHFLRVRWEKRKRLLHLFQRGAGPSFWFRLGFVLVNREAFVLDPLSALAVWQGGFEPEAQGGCPKLKTDETPSGRGLRLSDFVGANGA